MRAMSRRTSRIRAVFSSCPLARWKRRLNASLRKSPEQAVLELVVAFAQLTGLHRLYSSPRRDYETGLDRKLGRRQRKGRSATSRGTPSSSNMTRPGLTRPPTIPANPYPCPWRTSAGFCDTGTSGKMRIHSLPDTLHVTGDGPPRGFDLARRYAPGVIAFRAVSAES